MSDSHRVATLAATQAPRHYEDIGTACAACEMDPVPRHGCYVCRDTNRGPNDRWQDIHPGAWLCDSCYQAAYGRNQEQYLKDLQWIYDQPSFDRFISGAVRTGMYQLDSLLFQSYDCYNCQTPYAASQGHAYVGPGHHWLCDACTDQLCEGAEPIDFPPLKYKQYDMTVWMRETGCSEHEVMDAFNRHRSDDLAAPVLAREKVNMWWKQ